MNIGMILFAVAAVALVLYRLTTRTRAAAGPRTPGGVFQAQDPRVLMTIIASAVILLTGLYVILSNRYPPDTEKWAFGAVGTVIGFWLKP